MAGSAWTNQGTVAPVVVIGGTGNGVGLFVYNGTPANGNLIGSWAPAAGTDPFGNPYPIGFSATQGTFSGVVQAGEISNTPIGSSTITGSDYQGGTMEETVITFDTNGGQILIYANTVTTTTYTSTTTFTAPAGVTSVKAECWGAGGGGGGTQLNTGAGGGGGGEYARENSVGVTPASMYSITIGAAGSGGVAGGLDGGDGGTTTFAGDSLTVTAHGGKGGHNSGQHSPPAHGGVGGSGSGNSVHFNGGTGGSGYHTAGVNGTGGGGAGSAGTSSTGRNGGNAGNGSAGSGASAVTGGGAGGGGGNGADGSAPGAGPGGGGGGSGSGTSNTHTGGNGFKGQVKLTYVTGTALIGSWSAAAGTDSFSNSFPEGLMVDGVNAPVVALNPSTGTGPETWHTLSLSNSWGGTARYRLGPSKRVYVDIQIDSTNATSQTFGTLPSAYRPAGTVYIAAGSSNNVAAGSSAGNAGPFVQIQSNGTAIMAPLHAFTTAGTWVCGGSYPLD